MDWFKRAAPTHYKGIIFLFNNLQMLGSASNRTLFDKSNCWCHGHGHGHGHGPLVFMIITIWQDHQIILLFDNHCIIRTGSCWMSGLISASPQNLTSIWEEFFGGPQTFQSICIAPTALWEFFSYKEVWYDAHYKLLVCIKLVAA